MKISILVLNQNGGKYIPPCLDSITKLDTGPHKLQFSFIDNNSTDDSINLVRKKYPQFTIYQNPSDIGYSQGINRCLQSGIEDENEYFWLIGSNVIIAPNCLKFFLSDHKSNSREGILTCKVYFNPGHEQYPERYRPEDLGKIVWYAGGSIDWSSISPINRGIHEVDQGQYEYDIQTDFFTKACTLIKRQVIEQVGHFAPEYFYHLAEIDYSVRTTKVGYKIIYLHGPTAWYSPDQSIEKNLNLDDYFSTRNKLLLGLRYAPLYNKIALFQRAYNLLQYGGPEQKKGLKDYFSHQLGSGVYQSSI